MVEQLRPLVPSDLEIDTFQGKAYVGLIPFTVSGVRATLTPSLPFLSSFHEVNVRTYVHYRGKDPGVWFFSLDASSSIAVAAARAAYHLNYLAAEIDFTVLEERPPLIDFHSRRTADPSPANCHIRYAPSSGIVRQAAPGTLDHFLAERYVLYARSAERLYRARVHHSPYPLQDAEIHALEETLVWAAGLKRPEAIPIRHYSAGVQVEVFAPETLI
jgi:uncharacterized protein YqjF (DUF2071 family)